MHLNDSRLVTACFTAEPGSTETSFRSGCPGRSEAFGGRRASHPEGARPRQQKMALLRGTLLEREDTRARGAPGDGVLERRGRLRQRTCRRDVEREPPVRERLDQCGKPGPKI